LGNEKDREEEHIGGAVGSMTRVNMIDLVMEDDIL